MISCQIKLSIEDSISLLIAQETQHLFKVVKLALS